MDENWAVIAGFPHYIVSEAGAIVNTKTDKQMNTSRGGNGDLKVNLSYPVIGGYTTRSLARIVAETHVPREHLSLDTILFKDGNRDNIHASNLRWATRSYAIRYQRQFNEPMKESYTVSAVIDDLDNEFFNIIEAGQFYGVLFRDVYLSIILERPAAWIGRQFYWLTRG